MWVLQFVYVLPTGTRCAVAVRQRDYSASASRPAGVARSAICKDGYRGWHTVVLGRTAARKTLPNALRHYVCRWAEGTQFLRSFAPHSRRLEDEIAEEFWRATHKYGYPEF